MAFASAAELASFLQEADVDTATANLLLSAATGLIQAETGQTLELVTDDEVTLTAPRGYALQLPQRPVVEVTEVTIDGSTIDPSGYGLRGNVLYRASSWWAGLSGWDLWDAPSLPVQMTITYTHGYASIPDDVKGICLAAAARAYSNPAGMRSETVGSYSYTAAGDVGQAGVSLTEDERRILRRKYGRTAYSLTVSSCL